MVNSATRASEKGPFRYAIHGFRSVAIFFLHTVFLAVAMSMFAGAFPTLQSATLVLVQGILWLPLTLGGPLAVSLLAKRLLGRHSRMLVGA